MPIFATGVDTHNPDRLCVFAPLDETNNIIDKDEALLTLQKYPIFIPPIEWNKWCDIEANITPYGVTLH